MSWPLKRLGDLVDVKGGKRLPKGSAYSNVKTDHPYIRVVDFLNCSVNTENIVYISEEIQQKIKRYTITKDDVYISIAGSIGLVGSVPDELSGANLTENAAKLVISDKNILDKKYLIWFLSTEGQKGIHEKKKATSQPKLALFRIEELEIPLPPLKEQKRIAAILDKADAIRRKRQQAIAMADEFLRAVFLDMFGDPVANPMGWEVVALNDVLSSIDSGTSPKCDSRPALDGEWGVLKLGAISSCQFKHYENKAMLKGVEPQIKDKVEKGDLLFSRKNTYELVAAVALVEETPNNLLMPDLIFRLQTKSNIDKYYLWALLTHPGMRKIVQGFASGAAGSMPNISKTNLKTVVIPLPSMQVQEDYRVIHQFYSDFKKKLKNSLDTQNNLFSSLSTVSFVGNI